MKKIKKYCIVSADRIYHDTIMYIGNKQKCNKLCNAYYIHPKFGGIDAYVCEYDNFHKGLSKDKYFKIN